MNNAMTLALPNQNMLDKATKPEQSKAVEAVASAAKAWAKEQGDYEMLVNAMHLWIMARRKTTELIKPSIKQGPTKRHNNDVISLADYGFTAMQWHRRCKELEVSEDEIAAYFDDCIAKAWEPTLFGLHLWKDNGGVAHVSHNSGENEWYTPAEYCPACGRKMI